MATGKSAVLKSYGDIADAAAEVIRRLRGKPGQLPADVIAAVCNERGFDKISAEGVETQVKHRMSRRGVDFDLVQNGIVATHSARTVGAKQFGLAVREQTCKAPRKSTS